VYRLRQCGQARRCSNSSADCWVYPEWQKQPHALRRALTETMVDAANDPRARFVGIDAYINAGGLIDRDLFQPEHEGYLTDPAKLDRLVAEKLESLAAEVRGEGWKWVEIQPGAQQHPDLTKFDRICPVYVPISDEIRSEIEALQDEQEQIENAHPDDEEYPADVDKRMAEIESRIDELNDQPGKYREEEIALAGAIVSFENHGQAVIYRGLVRAEDKKKVQQAAQSGSNGQHEVGDNQGDEPDDAKLSAALVEDLTAHRTAALRAVLATRPDVALVAAAHSLALRVCYESCYDVCSCLSLTSEKGGCRLDSHAKGIETSPALVRLSEIHEQWLARIPAQAEELWQWLLDQEQTIVLDLLAFCIGQTVHAVRLNHDSGRSPRFVAADQLAQAVNLDMADWWTPSAESYLSRVKKEQILEAIGKGTSETNFEDLRKMKKAELVAAAERRLAGSRWLPEILKP
jgi:ParB family transcriptional regulator, chromosome partitioning protein